MCSVSVSLKDVEFTRFYPAMQVVHRYFHADCKCIFSQIDSNNMIYPTIIQSP
jgi:hypothetical protein